MKAFDITEVKKFMELLLKSEVFDHFCVSELLLQGACGIRLDGRRNSEFYEEEVYRLLPEKEYMLWSELKELVFRMIRGTRSPISFRIVFRLSAENTVRVQESSGTTIPLENIGGLFLNLQYDREHMSITSGTSLKTFSMDRTLEQAWDVYTERFLKKQEIEFK